LAVHGVLEYEDRRLTVVVDRQFVRGVEDDPSRLVVAIESCDGLAAPDATRITGDADDVLDE